jgi:hypothetical protein
MVRFDRHGELKNMAGKWSDGSAPETRHLIITRPGHDLNYLAHSGVLGVCLTSPWDLR